MRTINTKYHKGQIVIITVLLLATFGVIGASIATQMVFEQRKARLEEKTKEAYYAAESGIEQALKQLKDNPTNTSAIDLSEIGVGSGVTGNVSFNTAVGNSFAVPSILKPGEEFFLNLSGYTPTSLIMCWQNNATSVIATLVYSEGGVKKTHQYAINSSASQPDPKIGGSVGAPSTGTGVQGCGLSSGTNITLALPSGAGVTYDFLVIWPLYSSSAFAFQGSGASLPEQGVVITSQAQLQELSGAVSRSIQYFKSNRNYPPAYFFTPVFGSGSVTYGAGQNW
jgi:hypothetical protein